MGADTAIRTPIPAEAPRVPEGTDLIEWYYERGYSEGFPLLPPTPAQIAALIAVLAR